MEGKIENNVFYFRNSHLKKWSAYTLDNILLLINEDRKKKRVDKKEAKNQLMKNQLDLFKKGV